MSEGRVVGAVLAAGASRRFVGGPKQLAPYAGRPLIEHSVGAMLKARRVERTLVLLGSAADRILAGADLAAAEAVIVGDWWRGQSASLRAAVAAAGPEASALVVTLGDQPLIDARAIDKVVAAHCRDRPARASYDGRPGHPVVFPRRLFDDLAVLRGDVGARSVLSRSLVREVACDGLGSPADVDDVADLLRLKTNAVSSAAARGRRPAA